MFFPVMGARVLPTTRRPHVGPEQRGLGTDLLHLLLEHEAHVGLEKLRDRGRQGNIAGLTRPSHAHRAGPTLGRGGGSPGHDAPRRRGEALSAGGRGADGVDEGLYLRANGIDFDAERLEAILPELCTLAELRGGLNCFASDVSVRSPRHAGARRA